MAWNTATVKINYCGSKNTNYKIIILSRYRYDDSGHFESNRATQFLEIGAKTITKRADIKFLLKRAGVATLQTPPPYSCNSGTVFPATFVK